MFDSNTIDDFLLDLNLNLNLSIFSHSPNPPATSLSFLRSLYKRFHVYIANNFVILSLFYYLGCWKDHRRMMLALCAVYALMWGHEFLSETGRRSGTDVGGGGWGLPESVGLGSLVGEEREGMWDGFGVRCGPLSASLSITEPPENTGLIHASASTASALQQQRHGQGVQELCHHQEQQQGHAAKMLIFMEALVKDFSMYQSIPKIGVEEGTKVKESSIFDYPEQTAVQKPGHRQRQRGERIQQERAEEMILSGRDPATRTRRRTVPSWKNSAWTLLCNIVLVVLVVVTVRWCLTTTTLVSEEQEKGRVPPQAFESRISEARKAEHDPKVPHPIKTAEPVMPHMVNTAELNDTTAVRSVHPRLAQEPTGLSSKTNTEVVSLGMQDHIRLYSLETQLGDAVRAVAVRRQIIAGKVRATQQAAPTSTFDLSGLPCNEYDYERVMGACCENVIGYTPIPTGVAGPLKMDGKSIYIPMATTEGALVASTNRGCTAINESGGITSLVLGDGMTRGPCVRFPNLARAGAAKRWLDTDTGFWAVAAAFDSTSRFGRLQSIRSVVAGSEMFIRFKARTGDAMGMNMISKGVERALAAIAEAGFSDMRIVSLSGNYCTDKKAAAINWVDGRGKSVSAQALISPATLKRVLKVDVNSMVELNTSKNLVGSCLAGAMGGFNAHAANIVAAIFLATGQDVAQVVESSSCLTTMRNVDNHLEISVFMPSIEVGTVGGGTVLEAQGTMLDLVGVRGTHPKTPGHNAQELARIVAAGVLAGELSLCSALAAGSLVKSHMALNRK